MEALPDPVKTKNRVDEETNAEVTHHIEDCLTELVSQLDADHHLESELNNQMDPLQFMSMTVLCGNDKNHCGYMCITAPAVDATKCVFVLKMNATQNTVTLNRKSIPTFAPKIVSKSGLTRLSIQSIK